MALVPTREPRVDARPRCAVAGSARRWGAWRLAAALALTWPIAGARAQTTVFATGFLPGAQDRTHIFTNTPGKLSRNGRVVAFQVVRLVTPPGGPTYPPSYQVHTQVFVNDLLEDRYEELTPLPDALPAFSSQLGSISPDGRFVVYSTQDAGLIDGDSN